MPWSWLKVEIIAIEKVLEIRRGKSGKLIDCEICAIEKCRFDGVEMSAAWAAEEKTGRIAAAMATIVGNWRGVILVWSTFVFMNRGGDGPTTDPRHARPRGVWTPVRCGGTSITRSCRTPDNRVGWATGRRTRYILC